MEKKIKILVTGGAGFIGSYIVDYLIHDGHEVVVVDNLSSGNEKNVNEKARFYKLDIRSPELDTVFQNELPDFVNHQAAQVDVRRSVDDPIFDADVNILGSINVFQNCIKYNVKKIILASSGGAIYGDQDCFPAPENHSLKPISPYGITKLIAEQYLYYYNVVYGLEHVILRYANVYGPRQVPLGEAGVVAIFVQKMLHGKQPTINGDGNQTRDFVYVTDVARANVLATHDNISESVFNIGTGIEISVNKICDYLREIINPSIQVLYGPAKQGEQRRSAIDCSVAFKSLQWKPDISLMDGLRFTCQYFHNHV